MIPPAATPPVPLAPEASAARLDAYQSAPRDEGGLARAFSTAMDGFGARATQMQTNLREVVAREAATPPAAASTSTAAGAVDPAASAQPAGRGTGQTGAPGPLALMVDCFNFSIEASLVSRAAVQFTGSVSTLMKGQ